MPALTVRGPAGERRDHPHARRGAVDAECQRCRSGPATRHGAGGDWRHPGDWRGTLAVNNGKFLRAEPVNFLNPEKPLEVVEPGRRLAWRSVTTGNMAGIDLWLADGAAEEIMVETNLGGGTFAAAEIGREDIVKPAGGLGRQISLYRLPEALPVRVAHEATRSGPGDLPVYVRVTQEEGNQAWSSPIYLIAAPD